jgi:hypothetical protein
MFYGYPSMQARADASAGILYQFLDPFLTDPAASRNRALPMFRQPAGFRYRRVLIVAHSLGSIVARMMLLRAQRAARPWARDVELLLYAPAHMGARLVPLCESVLAAIGGRFGTAASGAIQGQFPVFDDLQPGSPTLQTLRQEVLDQVNVAPFLKAKKVVFGEFEKVVDTSRFPVDPDSEILPAKDHVNVCKPERLSERSYRLLAELL